LLKQITTDYLEKPQWRTHPKKWHLFRVTCGWEKVRLTETKQLLIMKTKQERARAVQGSTPQMRYARNRSQPSQSRSRILSHRDHLDSLYFNFIIYYLRREKIKERKTHHPSKQPGPVEDCCWGGGGWAYWGGA